MSVTDAQRQQLIQWCENSKCRRVAVEFPCKWKPSEVVNPDSGEFPMGFTDSSAWLYVAQLIRNGCDISVVDLVSPPNKKGFEILEPMPCGRYLYVKLMFGNGMVLARSFHYSDYTFEEKVN